jgi:hypothetical protein
MIFSRMPCSAVLLLCCGCGSGTPTETPHLDVISNSAQSAQGGAAADKLFVRLRNREARQRAITRIVTSCNCVEPRTSLPLNVRPNGEVEIAFEQTHPTESQLQVEISFFVDNSPVPALKVPLTVGNNDKFPDISYLPREVFWRTAGKSSPPTCVFHVTTLEIRGEKPWLSGCETSSPLVEASINDSPEEVEVSGNLVRRTYTISVSSIADALPYLKSEKTVR